MTKPVFRMSESGKCPKALSAELLGCEPIPVPAWLETAANEGKWHEERIIDKLHNEGKYTARHQEELVLEYPSFTLIGHIDGVTYNHPIEDAFALTRSEQLLEIKSMSQFEFDRWMKDRFKGFPNYASQISCYMEATGLNECLYIVKNRSSGYEDRKVLTEKPKHMTEIIGHLTDVTNHVLGNQLIERDFEAQSIECRRCEYKHLCAPEAKELTLLEEANLVIAVAEWRRGKALVERGQALIDKTREAFEQHTRATNILKWRYLDLAIQLVHYKESKTYPKAELLKVFTEEQLEPASKIKQAFDQLRIEDLAKEETNERD